MTVTEYRDQKKEQAKQLAKHTKGDLVDKLLFAYDTIKRLETKLQNTPSNNDYAKLSERLQSGRDYLMTVLPEELSVEKCLIAFGWDSNGFE